MTDCPVNSVMTVLLAEDDANDAELIAREINTAFHPVTRSTVYSKQEALLWLASNATPDLLFLDKDLKDGRDAPLVREIRAATTAPIIILTGDPESEDVQLAMIAGADDYVVKPVTADVLVRRANVIRGSRIRGVLKDRAALDEAEERYQRAKAESDRLDRVLGCRPGGNRVRP